MLVQEAVHTDSKGCFRLLFMQEINCKIAEHFQLQVNLLVKISHHFLGLVAGGKVVLVSLFVEVFEIGVSD